MKKIVYRLKEARVMKGLSISRASKGLGKNSYWLSKWEKGGFPMDSTALIMFANFYGVPVDYLVPSKHRPKVELTDISFCKLPDWA